MADPEFVQFHPTAINVGRDPAPLATEALRGEGAVLVNDRGPFVNGRVIDLSLAAAKGAAPAAIKEFKPMISPIHTIVSGGL